MADCAAAVAARSMVLLPRQSFRRVAVAAAAGTVPDLVVASLVFSDGVCHGGNTSLHFDNADVGEIERERWADIVYTDCGGGGGVYWRCADVSVERDCGKTFGIWCGGVPCARFRSGHHDGGRQKSRRGHCVYSRAAVGFAVKEAEAELRTSRLKLAQELVWALRATLLFSKLVALGGVATQEDASLPTPSCDQAAERSLWRPSLSRELPRQPMTLRDALLWQ
eukprot:TRINITY_DN38188_c0_g1_i1.p1 TRINITY_DN38188_c0_g1~~TRINITY_DN38188_c0_g1_i1.p1  ORF type:complete len:223 (-),score=34.83 TRINITY_DN38188_c0_g1_i1:231-899(-)